MFDRSFVVMDVMSPVFGQEVFGQLALTSGQCGPETLTKLIISGACPCYAPLVHYQGQMDIDVDLISGIARDTFSVHVIRANWGKHAS